MITIEIGWRLAVTLIVSVICLCFYRSQIRRVYSWHEEKQELKSTAEVKETTSVQKQALNMTAEDLRKWEAKGGKKADIFEP